MDTFPTLTLTPSEESFSSPSEKSSLPPSNASITSGKKEKGGRRNTVALVFSIISCISALIFGFVWILMSFQDGSGMLLVAVAAGFLIPWIVVPAVIALLLVKRKPLKVKDREENYNTHSGLSIENREIGDYARNLAIISLLSILLARRFINRGH